MSSLDLSHSPHLYAIAAAALVALTALVIFVIELRRVGGNVWPEWHNDRFVPLYQHSTSRGSRRRRGRVEVPPRATGRSQVA